MAKDTYTAKTNTIKNTQSNGYRQIIWDKRSWQ